MTWAWGVDVSTKRIAIAAAPLNGDNVITWHTDIEKGPRDAQRLHVIRTACHRHIALPRPSLIVVENPKTIRGGAVLIMVAGVVMEGLFGRYKVPTSDVPIPTWKKDVVGNGNASKEQISDHAFRVLGARPRNQDEADAACIAAWGRRSTA